MRLLCKSRSGIGISRTRIEVSLRGGKGMCAEFTHKLAQRNAISEDTVHEFRIMHANIARPFCFPAAFRKVDIRLRCVIANMLILHSNCAPEDQRVIRMSRKASHE